MYVNRSILAASAMLVSLAGTSMALAADYPKRPVNVIVASPPGAPNDLIIRLIAAPFAAALKQPLIAENRAGAGGNLAAELASRAPADGYTLLATINTVATVKPPRRCWLSVPSLIALKTSRPQPQTSSE